MIGTSSISFCRTLRITGRKKQSDEGAALFAVRVHAIVTFTLQDTVPQLKVLNYLPDPQSI